MQLTASQEFTLSAAARNDLEAFVILHRKKLESLVGNPAGIQAFIETHAHEIPEEVKKATQDFAAGETDILLLRNTSVTTQKNIPGTPTAPENVTRRHEEKLLYAPTMVLINGLIGGYVYEKTKAMDDFMHVIPALGQQHTTAYNDSHSLRLHMDKISLDDDVPELSGLACIRGQEAAVTKYYKIDKILEQLDPDVIEILNRPAFATQKRPEKKRAVLVNGRLNYHTSLKGQNPEAEKALETLKSTIENSDPIEVTLQSGDILFCRNDLYLHSRTSVDYRRGLNIGKNRWVVRTLGDCNPLFQPL